MKEQREQYDVIVCGGGTSGVMAALSAARNGMRVLILEKNAYFGGANTAAMVSPLMTFHAGKRQVVKGIAQEIIDRLKEKKATLGHIKDPIGMVSSITPIDSEALKMLYFEMLGSEPNVSVLLNSIITGVGISNGIIETVTVTTRAGKQIFKAALVVDATGDGDIISFAKENFVIGRTQDGMAQPMSLMFKVSGIRMDEVRQYIRANPEQFIWNSQCDVNDYVAVSGFFSLVKQAQENGDLNIPRDRVLFFQGLKEGEAIINMVRVIKLSGVAPDELTKAEFEAHAQVREIVAFLRQYVPGFADCRLEMVADMIGVRESRRLSGMYTLTADDVINNREQPDSVAVCAFPIDIHSPSGDELNWVRKEKYNCYDIPYRAMLPQKTKNLIVTGRCISATHEALASARISATAMALGEAAGLACAICIKNATSLHKLEVSELQDNLRKQGAVPGKRWL
ncbi:ribulose 1,5-bisphosphate synthetase/thiazole synthase [Anaerotaenia torta]|uniref:FAD-dependent oxidoreductase n=1 Tax=Anaerotaenia torta TaxID=433293 RepID=UPI003D263BE2